ncbi:MAG: polysaccharide biosynthesis/export family protein [Bacteroidia bacterium]
MAKYPFQLLLILFILIVSSCGKKLIYFQEKEDSKNKYNNIEVAKPENPRDHIIEAGDVLGLKINSTNTALLAEFANYLSNGSTIPGLMVQENGTIFLPYSGVIKISGISIIEAENLIISELGKSINSLTLELTLNSFRITILGEVKTPGIKNSPGDQLTIIDALSLSGDLGPDGKRSNIKVIRQVGDKKMTYFTDVSSIDIFRSEVYYLKSNDIVYIETLPKKIVRENITYISIFLTLVNTLGIFLVRF